MRHATTITYFERRFAAAGPPVYDACTAILIGLWVIPNQHFKSTLLGGGGGHKKEYAVYARENYDNSG